MRLSCLFVNAVPLSPAGHALLALLAALPLARCSGGLGPDIALRYYNTEGQALLRCWHGGGARNQVIISIGS